MKNLNYKNKPWLEKQYIINLKSIDIIACECGCSKSTVWEWLKIFNIPIRSQSETLKLGGRISGKNHPMYGKHHRPESIEKMRKNVPDYSGDKNPFFNKQHTEATKVNISEHQKSIWQTTEYRNKRLDWLLTDEAKQIAKDNLPKPKKGDKNTNWKGGRSLVHRNNKGWLKIRNLVFEKYGKKCLACGISNLEHKEKFGVDLCVHHTIPFYIINNNDLNNLIILCSSCHSKSQYYDDEKEDMVYLLDTWFLPKVQALEQLAGMK